MTRMKSLVPRLLAIVNAALIALALGVTPARADIGDGLPVSYFTKKTATLYLLPKFSGITNYYSLTAKEPIEDLKSSKKSVVEVSPSDEGTEGGWLLTCKKRGKAKLTFTYAGKKYTTTVTVKPYTSPAGKVVVGTKDITANYKKIKHTWAFGQFSDTADLAGKKLTVKPKAGWKLKSISTTISSGRKSKTVKIKNGTKLPKKCGVVNITFKNVKNGSIVTLGLS